MESRQEVFSVNNIQEVITNAEVLMRRYVWRNDFLFTSITHPGNIYDAIIIKSPKNARCSSPLLPSSPLSLEKHIAFINDYKIEKALIITDNIDFIIMCPTLKYIRIIPSDNACYTFDYSPLYKMPQIKSLQCPASYDPKKIPLTPIDCERINGLQSIHIADARYENYNRVCTLKSLGLTKYAKKDISEAFESPILDTLSIFQSKICTLDGIQHSQKIQCLYLYGNHNLNDLSALKNVKGTLKALRIENSPRITDFTVLGELENLELLQLSGTNELPNLRFLETMPKLKTLILGMVVVDGDISLCLNLSYVHLQRNRKHYNFKDSELPKGLYVRGNETIELWRRLE